MASFLDEVKKTVLTETNVCDLKRIFEEEIEKLIPYWAKLNVDGIKKSILETAKRTIEGEVVKGCVSFSFFSFYGHSYSGRTDLESIIGRMDAADLLKEYPELYFERWNRGSCSSWKKIDIRSAHVKCYGMKTDEWEAPQKQECCTTAVLAGYANRLREEITRQAAREGVKVTFCRGWGTNAMEFGSDVIHSRVEVEKWEDGGIYIHYEVRV